MLAPCGLGGGVPVSRHLLLGPWPFLRHGQQCGPLHPPPSPSTPPPVPAQSPSTAPLLSPSLSLSSTCQVPVPTSTCPHNPGQPPQPRSAGRRPYSLRHTTQCIPRLWNWDVSVFGDLLLLCRPQWANSADTTLRSKQNKAGRGEGQSWWVTPVSLPGAQRRPQEETE